MSASTRFVIVLSAAVLTWSCSAEPPPPVPDASEVDAQADGQSASDTVDMADAMSETQTSGGPIDPFACPGGGKPKRTSYVYMHLHINVYIGAYILLQVEPQTSLVLHEHI